MTEHNHDITDVDHHIAYAIQIGDCGCYHVYMRISCKCGHEIYIDHPVFGDESYDKCVDFMEGQGCQLKQ